MTDNRRMAFSWSLQLIEKATKLQVIENMPEMMQYKKKKKKSNSINHAKKKNSSKMNQEKNLYPAIVIEIDDA